MAKKYSNIMMPSHSLLMGSELTCLMGAERTLITVFCPNLVMKKQIGMQLMGIKD